jgi:two-component system response regulator HydG
MVEPKAKVLVVDDNRDHADAACEALKRVGYDVDAEYTSEGALERIGREDYDVIVTDLKLDGEDGITILKEARRNSAHVQVILLTGYGTVESAVEAMQSGALTYLTKGAGLNLAELRGVVARAAERARIAGGSEREAERRRQGSLEGMIGDSASMRRIARLVRSVAPTTATVLITGESGTGKELVAQAIHDNSPRRDKPFVTLNCAALSESLLESELFGHEKGAFTGASASRKGRFEFADGGTLFLDEVADMTPPAQVKLLRVLEYGEVFRIGSNEALRVDVRLVAATNKDLEREVSEGRFREDLYFRLKVVTLHLQPLRERPEDIGPLVDYFVHELARLHSRRIVEITPEARALITRYAWPGNVRELRNCIESMIVISDDDILDAADLPDYVLRRSQLALAPPQEPAPTAETPRLAGTTLRDAERELIRETLEETRGNREEAARILGIGERTLYRKITEYGLR